MTAIIAGQDQTSESRLNLRRYQLIFLGIILEIGFLLLLSFYHYPWARLLVIVFLVLVYYCCLISYRKSKLGLRFIIFIGVLFAITFLFFSPRGSGDVYNYALLSRIASVYHQNPYTVLPMQFPADIFFPHIGEAWHHLPLTYGPLWLFLSAPLGQIADNNLLLGALLFRLQAIVFATGSGILIYFIIKRIKPGYEKIAILLFSWNPFILFEVANGGHNDIMVAFFILLTIFLYIKNWKLWVVPSLTLSILIKYATIILLPAFILLILSDKRMQQKGIFWLRTILISLFILVVFYLPFWRGLETFRGALAQTIIFGQPFFYPNHFVFNLIRNNFHQLGSLFNTVSPVRLTGYIGMFVFLLLYINTLLTGGNSKMEMLLKKILYILAIFLLFGLTYFQPWYLLWLMPIAILIFVNNNQKLFVLLTLVSLLFYTFY